MGKGSKIIGGKCTWVGVGKGECAALKDGWEINVRREEQRREERR